MVDVSAVARVVGIDTKFKDLRAGRVTFLPQRIAVFAQGSTAVTYSTTKRQVTSAAEAGSVYGFGSPAHLAVRELLPVNGDGVGSIPVTVYPLVDLGGSVVAHGDIVPGGTATKATTFRVRIGGILSGQFTVAAGAVVAATVITAMIAAINGVLEMPFTASNGTTDVNLDAKWKGPSGNGILIEIRGPNGEDAVLNGVTFGITQPTGGTGEPAITAALAQMGNVWETLVLNATGQATAILDEFQTFGEGRWGELVRKPLIVFSGTNTAVVGTATTIPAARTTDRVNAQLVAPGSPNIPFVIAARQLARIAKLANNDPPHDYGSQKATGLIPGTDGQQWDYAARDLAVKAGSSTIEVRDGVINLSDIVTFYHPTGEEPPAYRYVVDIIKLQNTIFNFDLQFANDEWDGAPLIPDDQPTVNPSAKKPKMAVALAGAIVDSLGDHAIISDPATAKKSIVATIDSGNPKRLNMTLTVQLSGNTNIVSLTLNFGFFFGSQAAA